MTAWTPSPTREPITDPLTHPLADELRSARPDDLRLLHTDYLRAAEQARTTSQGLTRAAADTQWTGSAADAFRAAVGRLPAHLEAIEAGYANVASALSHYIDRVTEYQSQYSGYAPQLEEAQMRRAGMQSSFDEARRGFEKVLNAPGGPGHAAALATAQAAMNSARHQLDYWTGRASQLTSRTVEVLEDFLETRETTRHLVTLAASAAPQPAAPAATGEAPADVRAKLSAMNGTIGSLMGTPYVYGGGHGATFGPSTGGLDCSGFVSSVLHSAGYLSAPQTTEGLAAQPNLAAGHGQYVTLYDRVDAGDNDHVIMSVNGHFFEEGGSGGTQNVHAFTPSAAYLASFNRVLHPVGL